MKINLYLRPLIEISEMDISWEEFNLNWLHQVPHWYFVEYEDISFSKKINGEPTITKEHFEEYLRLMNAHKETQHKL